MTKNFDWSFTNIMLPPIKNIEFNNSYNLYRTKGRIRGIKMFCAKCGVKLTDESRFCSSCGARVRIEEK